VPGSLAARDISKSFADRIVLDRVSLTVAPGDRVGVIGPNGDRQVDPAPAARGARGAGRGPRRHGRRRRVPAPGSRGRARRRPCSPTSRAARASTPQSRRPIASPYDWRASRGSRAATPMRSTASWGSGATTSRAPRALPRQAGGDRTVTRVVELEAETGRVRDYAGTTSRGRRGSCGSSWRRRRRLGSWSSCEPRSSSAAAFGSARSTSSCDRRFLEQLDITRTIEL
jgi:hypothetical protein